jgi:hypothetical protein
MDSLSIFEERGSLLFVLAFIFEKKSQGRLFYHVVIRDARPSVNFR